jgi:hypothetical protein
MNGASPLVAGIEKALLNDVKRIYKANQTIGRNIGVMKLSSDSTVGPVLFFT